MADFLGGMITAGYLVGALFFLRYWARARDSLFAVFAAAFLLLALNQAAIVIAGIPREENSWIYLLRLAAFSLIIIAIVRKNIGARR